jgi:hypothetical protein
MTSPSHSRSYVLCHGHRHGCSTTQAAAEGQWSQRSPATSAAQVPSFCLWEKPPIFVSHEKWLDTAKNPKHNTTLSSELETASLMIMRNLHYLGWEGMVIWEMVVVAREWSPFVSPPRRTPPILTWQATTDDLSYTIGNSEHVVDTPSPA